MTLETELSATLMRCEVHRAWQTGGRSWRGSCGRQSSRLAVALRSCRYPASQPTSRPLLLLIIQMQGLAKLSIKDHSPNSCCARCAESLGLWVQVKLQTVKQRESRLRAQLMNVNDAYHTAVQGAEIREVKLKHMRQTVRVMLNMRKGPNTCSSIVASAGC